MKTKEEQQIYMKLVKNFLQFLNNCSDAFVFKGGTALILCYGLDRFSEDVDLDTLSQDKVSLQNILEQYCSNKGFHYRIAKQTATTERYILHYDSNQTLRIEVSHRKFATRENIKQIDGIQVYDIDTLCILKKGAYDNRMRLRDLYDLVFICNNYWNELSPAVKTAVVESLSRDALERFDYLIKQEHDDYIDNNKLATELLLLLDRLGLLENRKEQGNER
jgi:predicted nucleotidyltransferase component of viral defense system